MLDDGWFHARRDDTTGLGDWVVDHDVWPDGLDPLAGLVHELGMQFGLWFEPEMVNLDSDLARAHPELDPVEPGCGPVARRALVPHAVRARPREPRRVGAPALPDLGPRDAARDRLHQVGPQPRPRRARPRGPDGVSRPGTHVQTLAAYALIARLKADHPGLEIESCSSGGARTDLGILEVTDRVWASDSNDPLERQDIQRWTVAGAPARADRRARRAVADALVGADHRPLATGWPRRCRGTRASSGTC